MSETLFDVNLKGPYLLNPMIDSGKKLSTDQLGRAIAYTTEAIFGIPHNKEMSAAMGQEELFVAESWIEKFKAHGFISEKGGPDGD